MKLIKPDLNKPVYILFPQAAKDIQSGVCPTCGKKIVEDEFNESDAREYSISGLCPECQKQFVEN